MKYIYLKRAPVNDHDIVGAVKTLMDQLTEDLLQSNFKPKLMQDGLGNSYMAFEVRFMFEASGRYDREIIMAVYHPDHDILIVPDKEQKE